MIIPLPDTVQFIIDAIERGGFEACAVGGCVRDSLMGKEPGDWDIGSAATPEQLKKIFAGHKILETGLRHGTVTLLLRHEAYEITSYRIDGTYSDGRRPDAVVFTDDLHRDLCRRDFTVNAMAYHPARGLTDLFGGVEDLRTGVIRCVGDPYKRFGEDALRILRALRFAAVFAFGIDEDTARAMHGQKHLLQGIAAERITAEFDKLLAGKRAGTVLAAHMPLLLQILPELIGSEITPAASHREALHHTLCALDAAPPALPLRLALLLCGAAERGCLSENGEGVRESFRPGPAEADRVRRILARLKYDKKTVEATALLAEYYQAEIKGKSSVKRLLGKIGEERLRQLAAMKFVSKTAQAFPPEDGAAEAAEALLASINEICAKGECCSLKDLAVKGKDLTAIGIPPGPALGSMLDTLLDLVIEERIENDKAALLAYIAPPTKH